MTVDAYIAEPETDHGDFRGCVVIPCTITTEHPQSSHGQPVVAIGGEAYGPADIGGRHVIPPEGEDDLIKALDAAGYEMPWEYDISTHERTGVAAWDERCEECYEQGRPVKDHDGPINFDMSLQPAGGRWLNTDTSFAQRLDVDGIRLVAF
jgi:hypothetical protein